MTRCFGIRVGVAWLGLAPGLLLAQVAAVTTTVVIRVPENLRAAVTPCLQKWFGERIRIDGLVTSRDEPWPEPGIFLLCDEWRLARLAATHVVGDDVPVSLPFVAQYGWVLRCDLEAVPGSWEELALHAGLHDRLGIVAPDVDGSPWLIAMRDRLDRGEGQAGGFCLWTTIDARAGRLADSYAALAQQLAAGQLAAAIGPQSWVDGVVARSGGRLRSAQLTGAGPVWLGVALGDGAGPELRAVYDQLVAPTHLDELAAAVAVTVASAEPPGLPAPLALDWWSRFDTEVRGRGRGAEQLADWLDLGFGAAFLLCGWLVWRSYRQPSTQPTKGVS